MKEIYERLNEHQKKFTEYTLNDLFRDIFRAKKYSIKFEDFYFDFSKNFITQDSLNLLFELAGEMQLKEKIEGMFEGQKINTTEQRAVLHTALRNFSHNPVFVEGEDVMPKVHEVRSKMKKFTESVATGEWKGADGRKITDIVNIGIGGSHLGPAMATNALADYAETGLKVHYVSNIDSDDITTILKTLNPATTLFIIASKTFTTLETMRNAETAKKWFTEKFTSAESLISKHFIALSTNETACSEFGIPRENMFEFWDWVGGRYSLWSSIGLSTALAIGWDNFEEMLRGAYEIDRHFRSAPFEENIPVIFGLLTVWYSTFWRFKTNAVIPYSHRLSKFPEFLRQLDMESNGKSVRHNSDKVDYQTGQVVWGDAGTNSQHSFFQLIHQGTEKIPVDFVGFVEPHSQVSDHHQWLLSNMIGQSEALMKGKPREQVLYEMLNSTGSRENIEKLIPHKVFEGNRPSNIILIDKLTPKSLGKLIALFEHKVFVCGVIWDINSFDQWGVELGKQLSQTIYRDLSSGEEITSHDSSTNSIINFIKNKQFYK